MEYKNITVQIENLSDSHKSDLKSAEILLGFMNTVINMIPETTLTYNGHNFIANGYESGWVMRHISNIINTTPSDYKKFALDELENLLVKPTENSVSTQVYIDRNIYFHESHLKIIPESENEWSEVIRFLIQSLKPFSSESKNS